MVLLEKLKEVDHSFQVIASRENVKQITTLCSLDALKEGCIVFIKDKKYYTDLIDQYGASKMLSKCGIVFQGSFYKAENDTGQSKEFDQFRFHAIVENVDLALSRFSKLFFDEIAKTGNDLKDGRDAHA